MSESRWDKTAIEFSSKNHKILFSMTGVHEVITQGIFIEGCKHAEKELLTEQALHYVRAKQQARAEVIAEVKKRLFLVSEQQANQKQEYAKPIESAPYIMWQAVQYELDKMLFELSKNTE